MNNYPEYLILDDFGEDLPRINCETKTLEEIERINLGMTPVEYFYKKFKEKIIEVNVVKLNTEAQKVKNSNSMLIKI